MENDAVGISVIDATPAQQSPRRFTRRRFTRILAWLRRRGSAIPLWLTLASFPTALVAFALTVLAFGHDWADGARIAVLAAAVVCALAVVSAFVLLVRRQLRPLSLGLSGALLVVVALSSLGALAWQPALHTLQARALENNKAWAAALQEYALGGETAPDAPNRARVEVEWGEAQAKAHQFIDALGHFAQAQAESPSNASTVERAFLDLAQTYHQWLTADPKAFPTGDASAFFDTYLASGFCSSSCRQSVHSFMAQVLWSRGHDQFLATGFCNLAIPDYQNLAANYGDTTQGKAAAAALVAPVDTSGTVENIPAGALTASRRAYLSRTLAPMVLDEIRYYSDDYSTTLDSAGNFTFHGVVPGNYNLSVDLSNGQREYWRYPSPFNPYTVDVEPLCGAVAVDYYY